MNNIYSKILKILSKISGSTFDILIISSSFFLEIGKAFRNLIIFPIIILLLILFSVFPFLSILLFTRMGIFLMIMLSIALILPLFSRKILNLSIKYKYVLVNYFKEKSKDIKNGNKHTKKVSYYSNEYDKKIEEEILRRQREQQKQYEEFFRNFSYGTYNNSQNYNNMYINNDFKQNYEKNCDILRVSYMANIDEIKSRFRKLAKKYHPDINKDLDSIEKFKKIKEAYEFLSEENINRYKNFM